MSMNQYLLPKDGVKISCGFLINETLILLINKKDEYAIFDFQQQQYYRKYHPLGWKPTHKYLRMVVAMPYIALAEDYSQNGILLSITSADYRFRFTRNNYQVENCQFPLALYQKGAFHYLIYGSDWNRVEHICIQTMEQLIPPCLGNKQEQLDYFHSSIYLAPNKESFLSNGWVWAPIDIILQFNLNKMARAQCPSYESMKQLPEGSGYNWDRPCCWVNNHLFAVVYNSQEQNWETAKKEPSHIIIYDLSMHHFNKKIETFAFPVNNYGEVSGQLFYNKKADLFICLSKKKGLYLVNRSGDHLFNNNLPNWQYASHVEQLYFLLDQSLYSCNIDDLLKSI